ncbi:hypothetical protein ACJMK2_034515, partial [Sinanodonta woodiana]
SSLVESSVDSSVSETQTLLSGNIQGHGNPFLITERTELGQMASMFYNKVGEKLFYLCIVIYLYGDLAIYGAAVPKSIRDVACTYRLTPNTTNGTSYCDGNLTDSDLCWTSTSLTRADAYRIFVAAFLVCLGPLTFFNVQKTKYLQILTTLTRWTAFVMMIILAIINLSRGKGEGHPVVANFVGVPNLFGVCVYSFMCHHSLPSLITPIKDKSKLLGLMGLDYLIILIFYALLSFTGIYVFNNVKDVYTLNFLPDDCGISKSITDVPFIQYVLALFPVFTLSTNFPIISITLRNNLKTIWYNKNKPYPYVVDKYVFPLLAILPPAALAFGTDQVGFLVGITGSYAGAAIQYIIPATLVYFARKKAAEFDEGNIHSSMFRSRVWIILVIVWAILCIGFVTVNHIITRQ